MSSRKKNDINDCLDRAKYAEDQAQRAENEADRVAWLQVAEEWRNAADIAIRTSSGSMSYADQSNRASTPDTVGELAVANGPALSFKVVAIRDGKKSPPLDYDKIDDANVEAENSSRHLAQSAIVYAPGEPEPRCIYEHGKLVNCRCS